MKKRLKLRGWKWVYQLAFICWLSMISLSELAAQVEAIKQPQGSYQPSKSLEMGDWKAYQRFGHRAKQWDHLVKSGFETWQASNYATAAIFLNKAYAKGCRDALVLFKLGIYYELKQNIAKAVNMLVLSAEKFPRQYPRHPDAGRIGEHAGRLLYQLDEFNRALPFLEAALKAEPNNFMLLFMSGQILRMQKNYQAAKERFEHALLQTAPKDIQPNPRVVLLRELVILTYNSNDHTKCSVYIKQLLALAPADKTALFYQEKLNQTKHKAKERELLKKLVK